MGGWGLALLRVLVGIAILAHGFQAVMPVLGWTPSPLVMATPAPDAGRAALWVGLIQLLGGALLIVGAFARALAVVLAIERAASLWLVHLSHGFFLNWTLAPGVGHGYEYHLVVVAALLCLALEGGGELSVDAVRLRRAELDALGRARLRARKIP